MYDLDEPAAMGFPGKQLPKVIDAHFDGNATRFLNHSCDPNLMILKNRTFNQHCIKTYQIQRLVFVTLRSISQGEDSDWMAVRSVFLGEFLTVDYCPRFDNDERESSRVTEPCRCGAIYCRGWLAP